MDPMTPERMEKYIALAKQLNVSQGELVKFVCSKIREDREKCILQWEQERIERRRRDEEERKERLRLRAERIRAEEERYQEKNELPMRK